MARRDLLSIWFILIDTYYGRNGEVLETDAAE